MKNLFKSILKIYTFYQANKWWINPFVKKTINIVKNKYRKIMNSINKKQVVMKRDFKGAMSPETEKELGAKFKFKNKIAELVDDSLIKIVDNNILDPLIKKLPEDIANVVIETLAVVIEEMPTVEI